MPPFFRMTPYHSYPHLMGILSMLFFLLTMTLSSSESSLIMDWTMLTLNSTQMSIPVLLDPMNTMFMTTVTFISYNVLTFSKTYMAEEPNLTRFTHLIAMFILSMLLLIMSPNLISMMLGWDGLGFTSFLLVIFYQNSQSLKSGMITALTNRVGDALLLIAIALIMSQGHWMMMSMWKEMLYSSPATTIMITMAAMTKSAQYPFVAWLPEAMAAPTPVSALVHSSTLVTAGVFILIRLYPFLSETKAFNSILLSSGLLTSLFGAMWSSAHPDQKKAVALSTLSQLGLMMVSLSLNMMTFCFIHLLTHAMFKATLFISIGVSIVYKHHQQFKSNLRMHTFLPPVSAAAGLSLLSMNAFFFLAGYYSKEIILETSIYNPWTLIVFLIMGIATYFTTVYSIPLWRINVVSGLTQNQYPYENTMTSTKVWYANSKNTTLMTPVILMSIASISMGSVGFGFFMPPTELPIMPTYMHLTAFMWPMIGFITAVNFCRQTTKYYSPISIFPELIIIAFDKGSKNYVKFLEEKEMIFKLFSLPMKIFMISCLVKMKIGYKLENRKVKRWNLSNANQWKPWPLLDPMHNSHTTIANKDNIRHDTGNLWDQLDFTYELALPVMNMSLSTLKALDQGLTTMLTANGLKKIFPKMSTQTLIHQANHSTKTLLLFILLMFMILPIII